MAGGARGAGPRGGGGKVTAADAPRITHPDRVLFPREGYTKGDVLAYFDAVAEVLLPHLRDRPLALERHPQGVGGPSFFQQHALRGTPGWVRTELVPRATVAPSQCIVCDDRRTLLWLANYGAFTQHVWLSRIGSLDEPDWVLFDMDPGERSFVELVEVTTTLRRRLEARGVEGFPKTTGKRGLHVLVPLSRGARFEVVVAWARAVAEQVVLAHPGLATLERSLARRRGAIYVDVLQNARGKTMAAPYTVRAVHGAQVSTPLRWSEVNSRLDPSRFTLRTVPARVARVGDLFAPLLDPGGGARPLAPAA